ncbi:Trypsin [compost metagenome]
MVRLFLAISLIGVLSCSPQAPSKFSHTPQSAVVYGEDNRQDFYEIQDPLWKSRALSTVAIISAEKLQDVGAKFRVASEILGGSYKLCQGENYFEQPVVANCSGVLVAQNIILTAGHCILDANDCRDQRFVFDYTVQGPRQFPLELSKQNVYTCKKVVKRGFDKKSGDFALVELDRNVTGREAVDLSEGASVGLNEEVTSIAYPTGLPVKFTPGGRVRQISGGYFVTNLDTFSGSSGGPVFRTQTKELVGILVRGEKDFSWDKARGCLVVNQCAEGGCRGEDVISIPHILSLIK